MTCALFSHFNSSVWNALWLLLPPGVIAFIWCRVRLKGESYSFDAKNSGDSTLADAGDYERHSQRYQDISKLAVTISGAAIAFLIGVLVSEKPTDPVFAARVRDVAPIVCGLFGFCITLFFAFMILQAVWYEEYCHSPTHDSYKAWKYALSTSMGVMGLFAFVLGFLWLAANVFAR